MFGKKPKFLVQVAKNINVLLISAVEFGEPFPLHFFCCSCHGPEWATVKNKMFKRY
jgi:hypothetical protein